MIGWTFITFYYTDDATRVILKGADDYINANYINVSALLWLSKFFSTLVVSLVFRAMNVWFILDGDPQNRWSKALYRLSRASSWYLLWILADGLGTERPPGGYAHDTSRAWQGRNILTIIWNLEKDTNCVYTFFVGYYLPITSVLYKLMFCL